MFGSTYHGDPIEFAIIQHTRPLTAREEWEDACAAHKRAVDQAEIAGVCPECNAQGCPACYYTGLIPQTLDQARADALEALAGEIDAAIKAHSLEWDHDWPVVNQAIDALKAACCGLRSAARQTREIGKRQRAEAGRS